MGANMSNIGTLRRISTSPIAMEWNIDDYHFDKPYLPNTSFESPLFIFGEATWHLRLFPNGERNRNTVDSVELFLLKKQSFDDIHHISCTVGIQHDSRTIGNYKSCSLTFNRRDQTYRVYIINRSQLQRLRTSLDSNKIFTVIVKDLVHHNSLNTCTDSKTQIQRIDKGTSTGIEILSKKLKGLFLNEEGCDVTFKVENTELRAHKSVLIAQSPVFASMFRHEMSETITGIVKIADCTPDAFRALLLYLYSGIVENLSADIVYDLYEAAVKYDLEYLKNKCIKFMEDGMSADTLCDTITFCQKYKEFELLQHATNYFIEHVLDILLTVKWQLFLKEDPTTANELYIKAVQKK